MSKEFVKKYGDPEHGIADTGWFRLEGDPPVYLFRAPGGHLTFRVECQVPVNKWALFCNDRLVYHNGSASRHDCHLFDADEDARRWAEALVLAIYTRMMDPEPEE